jgi:hypothetical protein
VEPQIKEMHIRLIRYFQAEKGASALLLGVAGAVLVGCFLLWRSEPLPLRPMMWPLLVIAALQIIVGTTVYTRTDAQVADLIQKLQKSPPVFAAQEEIRMARVMRSFRLYRGIEIGLISVGAVLALFLRPRGDWMPWAGWPAVGAGLMIQAAMMLVFDFYAERRAEPYLDAVQRLSRSRNCTLL